MPIELNCSGCGQTLRVPDDAAGKQARCPNCKTVQPIPGPAAQGSSKPPSEEPFYIPPEAEQPGNPFAGGSTNPYADQPVNPYASPSAPAPSHGYTPARRYTRPHRGGVILALGIISIVCNLCFIPSIMALVMANEDLKHMNEGRMDPSGRTLTTIGMVLGVVGVVIGVLGGILRVMVAMAN